MRRPRRSCLEPRRDRFPSVCGGPSTLNLRPSTVFPPPTRRETPRAFGAFMAFFQLGHGYCPPLSGGHPARPDLRLQTERFMMPASPPFSIWVLAGVFRCTLVISALRVGSTAPGKNDARRYPGSAAGNFESQSLGVFAGKSEKEMEDRIFPAALVASGGTRWHVPP